jgi:phosphate transport system substrate-binding protein
MPATTSAATPSAATRSHPVAALSLCGSNTIGLQLGPELIRAFVSDKLGGRNVRVDVGAKPDEWVVRADVANQPFHIDIAAHGSATAFEGLHAGSCQVGMASRRIHPGEILRDQNLFGDLTGRAAEHIVGLDGIAVIVHRSNPVKHLTIDQLRRLFSGAVTSWSQVGGRPGPVHVYARDDKSGTYDMFVTFVLQTQHLAPSARRFEDSTKLADSVARDPHGIGFIGLPYINRTKALEIASGSATPIYPTTLSVGREQYPLTRRLYLYTAVNPANQLVRRFISFAQSDEGQRIVNRVGFVGTLAASSPPSRSVAIPAGAPPAYANLLRTADREDFTVFFDSDSYLLDNKAYVDVRRLAEGMSTGGYRSHKFIVAGFADSTGDPEYSRFLSEMRAHSVAAELTSLGLTVAQTFGFGQAVPIRDNGTLDGQAKNRRVEIFITH